MAKNPLVCNGEIRTHLFLSLIGPPNPRRTEQIEAILLHPTQEDLAYDAWACAPGRRELAPPPNWRNSHSA